MDATLRQRHFVQDGLDPPASIAAETNLHNHQRPRPAADPCASGKLWFQLLILGLLAHSSGFPLPD